jgi:hypothetical protein
LSLQKEGGGEPPTMALTCHFWVILRIPLSVYSES